jgi:hypothetical protein
VYHFVKASFYQNDVLFDYSIKMPGFMPILRLCYVQMYSVRHEVDIDFQPLALKSDRKGGGILGTEVSNLINHIFKTQTIHYKNAFNVASEISTQTILFHRNKIYTYVSIPYTTFPLLGNRS